MAAENYVMCLIDGMDHLWFHHIILSPQPSLFHPSEDAEILVDSSEYSSKIDNSGQEISSTPQKTFSSDDHGKTEFHSDSFTRNLPRMQKSTSCKSLIELELEEVRGFIDLGFNFRRENLSNHILNLLPGLQRIDGSCKFDEINEDDDEDEETKDVMRPYLSEAWIVRRPDSSPLLNLRMPASDMKKHLKFWAQTVALHLLES